MAHQTEEAGGGLVDFAGVQSNQFPSVMDLARPLRAAAIPVCIGGFRVSDCLAVLPETPDSLKAALDLGISLFVGEAEGRFTDVLRDAARGEMKPIYNYLDDLPGLEDAMAPMLPLERVNRTIGMIASFDAGRGCPFLCSFCTIINVQGRKSRYRTPDDIEALVRANYAKAFAIISSPTTTSPATGTGRRSSIGSLRFGRRSQLAFRDSGQHGVPQDRALRRKGDGGRRQTGVHRA